MSQNNQDKNDKDIDVTKMLLNDEMPQIGPGTNFAEQIKQSQKNFKKNLEEMNKKNKIKNKIKHITPKKVSTTKINKNKGNSR